MKNSQFTIHNVQTKIGNWKLEIHQGFTLLEVVVSATIIAVISIVVVQAFFSTAKSGSKSEVLKEVKQNGDFALSTMERMIRNAKADSVSCLNNTVTITNPDSGVTTFGCLVEGAVTKIASTSSTGTDLLTSNIVTLGGVDSLGSPDCTASTLVITCSVGAGVPTSVTLSFTLSQKGVTPIDQSANTTFQTIVTARN